MKSICFCQVSFKYFIFPEEETKRKRELVVARKENFFVYALFVCFFLMGSEENIKRIGERRETWVKVKWFKRDGDDRKRREKHTQI